MSSAYSDASDAARYAVMFVGDLKRHTGRIDELQADLPPAFPGVAKAFPVASNVLRSIAEGLEAKKSVKNPKYEELYPVITEHLENAQAKAKKLHDILKYVLSDRKDSRMALYRDKADADTTVEKLALGILEPLGKVADTELNLVGDAEKKELEAIITEVQNLPASIAPEAQSTYAFYNYGSGTQNNHAGKGDMYNNSGQAPQIGGTINGGVYINSPPPAEKRPETPTKSSRFSRG